MAYDGLTPTKFGRIQTAPPLQVHRLHIADETAPLREIQHTIPLPVLDQEDLLAQGIDTSALVTGARKVDALGSCTCNAGTAHAAERLTAAGFPLNHACLELARDGVTLAADAKTAEEFAILLYHLVTSQAGDPATEWPPADCGSSGYYVCTELEKQGLARGYKTAANIQSALSLLQAGTVMQGTTWFEAWFTPDSQGFIDGDGSHDAFTAAVASGVAGGHETLQTGITQLAQTASGIDLANTVIRVRNSWSANWNAPLAGDFLIHASTLNYLGNMADYKQISV